VNLTGTFLCARAVARAMKEAGKGAIVNMASGRALAGAAKGAHYSASKGGIIALTKSLALDWAPYGIRVNCVIPGVTDTAQPRGELSDDELYALGSHIPLGRIAQPQDIAAAVAFLLGEDSAYMTGQSIAVNGGAIMIPLWQTAQRSLIDRGAGCGDHLAPFFGIRLHCRQHLLRRAGDDLHPLRRKRGDESRVRCHFLDFLRQSIDHGLPRLRRREHPEP